MAHNERGQLMPFVALALVLIAGSALLLGRLAEAAEHRTRARTAADAAALAGAAEGQAAARRLAEANGGRLVGFEERGGAVWVTVEHGPARARATGERTLITHDPDG